MPRDGDHEVVHGDLLFGRGARAAEVRDLVCTQQRARGDVSDAPLRQVDDLGEDGIRLQRLLGAQVPLDRPLQLGVAVGEPAEEAGAGRPHALPEQQLKLAGVQRLLRSCGEHGPHRERVRKRLRLVDGKDVQVPAVE